MDLHLQQKEKRSIVKCTTGLVRAANQVRKRDALLTIIVSEHTTISPVASPRVASGYSVQTLNNSLASYDKNYVCHKCISVPKLGVTTKKFSAALPVPF